MTQQPNCYNFSDVDLGNCSDGGKTQVVDAPDDFGSQDPSEPSKLAEIATSLKSRCFPHPVEVSPLHNSRAPAQDLPPYPFLAAKPVSRIKWQHNPAGDRLGLIREESKNPERCCKNGLP